MIYGSLKRPELSEDSLVVSTSLGMPESRLCALEDALACLRIAKQLHNTFLFAILLKLNQTSRFKLRSKAEIQALCLMSNTHAL